MFKAKWTLVLHLVTDYNIYYN